VKKSPTTRLAQSGSEAVVEVADLVKRFGGRTVLDGTSFSVQRGETVVIMGGSGCGKSTLLRHLIGSLQPTAGSIKLFGEEITNLRERELDVLRERFGTLFQTGALLASMTVAENVALPLWQHRKGITNAEVERIVHEKLALVGMTGFEGYKPAEISGGMKKRVGLARALALDPELLFSDEPTSGLDPIMTAVVDRLTHGLTRKLGMTAVVVTHDMTSAFRIGSRFIMLGSGERQGKIIATGTPEEIRDHPDPDVQQFIKGEVGDELPLEGDDEMDEASPLDAPPTGRRNA
jgi:phospholipid/cholesterol/gamma-HCH transport system ATP-binding protein